MESVAKSKQIADQLITRLKRNEANVKLKTLKTIKYLIINGRSEFQKEMGTQANAIKSCLQFQGPPDPLKGDEPYTMVHNAARECLDCLFDENVRYASSAALQLPSATAQTLGRPMEGVSAAGPAAAAAAPAKGGYTGIGGGSRSAAADDWMARAKGSFGGAVAPAAAPAAPVAAPAAAAPVAPVAPAAAPVRRPLPLPASRSRSPLSAATTPPPRVRVCSLVARSFSRGVCLAASLSPALVPPPPPLPPAPTPPPSLSPSRLVPPTPMGMRLPRLSIPSVYERKLVDELCSAQGMKPTPPEDKLAKFRVACQTLDATVRPSPPRRVLGRRPHHPQEARR